MSETLTEQTILEPVNNQLNEAPEVVPEVKADHTPDANNVVPEVKVSDSVPPNVDDNTKHTKSQPASPTVNTKKRNVEKPADLRLNTNQVEQILDCIKSVLDGRKPSAGAMLRIVANCLQSSRRMKLKPDLAKKLISHSMETFLRDPDNELDEDSIQTLMACADVTINEGIDVLDDVGKGKIAVNPKACCVIV